jgi:hypothetical protein
VIALAPTACLQPSSGTSATRAAGPPQPAAATAVAIRAVPRAFTTYMILSSR